MEATHISSDIEFKGEVQLEDKLVIDGKVDGNILSNGSVIIKSGAKVRADLRVKNVEIEGALQGNVIAKELTRLASSANMIGDINCKLIEIERGANHNGITVMK